MCGLAGFVDAAGDNATNVAIASRMAELLAHRGPDDAGVWADDSGTAAIAHRRLSIVDVSPAGHQPMHSHCGRYVIAFNGEIYNHVEIRKALGFGAPTPWRGHSDTETLIEAIARFGCLRALQQCVGMFAFALWDRRDRTLTLARDRFGEKPLYYGRIGHSFAFASELKAFRAHPDWRPEIDRGALTLMMRHGCVPAPYSIFKGMRKVVPGQFLTLAAGPEAPTTVTYWSAHEAAKRGCANPFRGTAKDAVIDFDRLLTQSVSGQLMSDVPLGAFLSGGVDSSTVAALMQSAVARPVRTFSIGFDDAAFDEARHAKAVANHLGTDHTELYITDQDARDIIPQLPSIYCEPFADASQIPTALLSRLARASVCVALTGDAGDEVFSGYTRYRVAGDVWNTLARVPRPLRGAAARALAAVPSRAYDRAHAALSLVLPSQTRLANFGGKMHEAAELLALETIDDAYRRLTSHWIRPSEIVIGGIEPPTMLTGLAPLPQMSGDVEAMMFKDLISYLPDDILVKVDRAAMASSLETRVPFLDHRLIEFSLSVPASILRAEGKSKWPLRQILYRHVPPALIERPKAGFAVPIAQWLRGPLRGWAEALLDPRRLKSEGFFEAAPIAEALRTHNSGRRDHSQMLWNVLMFQCWRESQSNSS